METVENKNRFSTVPTSRYLAVKIRTDHLHKRFDATGGLKAFTRSENVPSLSQRVRARPFKFIRPNLSVIGQTIFFETNPHGIGR